MNIKPLWEKKYKITTYHTGPGARASLTSLCNFFQETAWQHARHASLGYYDLKEKGYLWILSRLRVVVKRYPKWNEKINVLTWPKYSDRLFAYRDFEVTDKDSEIIAGATSGWLVLDEKTRRPQRMSKISDKMKFTSNREAVADELEKLSFDVEGEEVSFEVKYSHLDLNEHVNNVKYIEWILNEHPENILTDYNVCDFRIDFKSETKLGDRVNLKISESEEKDSPIFNALIKKEKNNEVVCNAKIKWSRENIKK